MLPLIFLFVLMLISRSVAYTPFPVYQAASSYVEGSKLVVIGGIPSTTINTASTQAFELDLSVSWPVSTPVYKKLPDGPSVYGAPCSIINGSVMLIANSSVYSLEGFWGLQLTNSNIGSIQVINNQTLGLSAVTNPSSAEILVPGGYLPNRMAIINPFNKTVSFAPMYAADVAPLYSIDWSKSLNGLVLLDTSGVLQIYTTAGQWNTPITIGVGPSPRNTACLVSAGDEIIVYGGYSRDLKMSLGDIHILNITSMTWRSGASNTAENNRSKASCGYSNGQLIVWGGVNSGQQADILGTATPLIYNVKADQWVSNYLAPTIAQPNPTNSGSTPSSGGTSNPTGTTSPQGAQPTGGSNVAMIVGIAGGLFTLLALGGLLFLYKLKRRKITNLYTENNNEFGNADMKNAPPLSPSSTPSLSPHSCPSQPLPVYQAPYPSLNSRAPQQYSPQAEGVKEQRRVYYPQGINKFHGMSDNSILPGPHTQQ